MDNTTNPNPPFNPNPPSPTPTTPTPPAWPPVTPPEQPIAQPTSPWSTPATPPTWPSEPSLTQTTPPLPWASQPIIPPLDITPPPEQQPIPQPNSPWSAAPTSYPTTNTATLTTPVTSEPISTPPQVENAPTDLSQLIANNTLTSTEVNTQASATPETLIVSQANSVSPEVPTLPVQGHHGIPKWLIGVGIGLLIVVAGASAYFILGVGQDPKTTTSVPAVTEVNNPAPVVTPAPQPTSEATTSGSFGQVEGNASAQSPTSAAEILRQRQQQAASNP